MFPVFCMCVAWTPERKPVKFLVFSKHRISIMPLSEFESAQLASLLAKARNSDGAGLPSDLDGFDLISESEGALSMTDGSKRREDEPPSDEPCGKRCSAMPSAGYGSANVASPWIAAPDADAHLEKPKVEDSSLKQFDGSKCKGTRRVTLPPDVPNAMMWGRTVVNFGMYRENKISYDELRNSSEVRAVAYLKWCKARAFSAEGYLRDFAQYLLFMDQLESDAGFTNGPLIPGTASRRQYK